MKHIFILLLFLDNVDFISTNEECLQLPTVGRAFVLDEYKKTQYQQGDVIYFSCNPGYITGFNTTYICTEYGWRAATIGHCIEEGTFPLRLGCPRPPALENGYVLKNNSYFYEDGQRVRYQCEHHYRLKGESLKTCSNGIWTGGDIQCLAKCSLITVDDKVQVDGDLDQPMPGSVLQFSCRSGDDELNGPSQIICDDNGNWDNEPPTCKEISCSNPPLDNFQVEGMKTKYKKDEILRYSCNTGFKKVDGRPSVCKKVVQSAKWTPTPQCEIVTCKLSQTPPPGTKYNPVNQNIFLPGQNVTVSCGIKQWVKHKSLQSAELTCQHTGQWDFDPVCQWVKCSKIAENVHRWEHSWYQSYSADIDQSVWYECHRDYVKASYRAKCTREGWEPHPLCKEKTCTKPLYKNAIPHNDKDEYENYERVHWRCTYEPSVTFSVDCYLGDWIGTIQTCKEKPCSTQPNIENGERLQHMKREYEHGERLQFRCEGETETFTVTCKSGEWKKEKSCQDLPCTEQPNITNGEMFGQKKLQYKHGEKVEITCTTDTMEKFYVSCQSGEWHSEHQCPEKSVCGNKMIPNGFSHEDQRQNKLYYSCNEGFKLLTKGWWGVASCEGNKWKTSECVEVTDCGPVPDIPNMITSSDLPKFSEGETLRIHCAAGHQNVHRNLQDLTCTNGIWTANNVPFDQICTPIAKKCPPPLQIQNAVIKAFFEKEYPSHTRLTYKCRDNFMMEGEDTIQCNNGVWGDEAIRCKEVTCELPAPNPNVNILEAEGNRVTAGNRITVQCVTGGSAVQLECLSTGQWNSTFPSCADTCAVEHVPDSVLFSPRNVRQLQSGQRLVFRCKDGSHILRGAESVTCLENGQWSHTFPSCAEVTCDLPAPSTKVNILGVDGDQVTAGNSIVVQCVTGGNSEQLQCLSTGQWSSTFPTCFDTCDVEHVPDSVVYSPRNVRQLQRGKQLRFRCKDDSHIFHGAESVTCLENEQWSHPFPSCAEVTCELPAPNTKVKIVGVEGESVTAGNSITVQCVTGGKSKQLRCLSTGQWSSPFPFCSDTCDVAHVPDSLLFRPPNVRLRTRGQSLTFRCKNGSHIIRGAESVTCLEDGQWSHPFPSCAVPQSCGTPPSLENGDFLASNTEMVHNTQVEYLCQSKYVMEGGPYKTCLDGVWTGEITCLNPCTVNPALMTPNNIKFIRRYANKLYAPHNDYLTFECVEGTIHDGAVELRQKCNNGVMVLPRCV